MGFSLAGRKPVPTSNADVVRSLREMAVLLEAQGDNPFRVAAYRQAADTVARLTQPVEQLYAEGGLAGLDALPGVGQRIAAAIGEMVSTGRWLQLDRLRGNADPVALFRTIPGVGPELAWRMHEELGVDTLEALSGAAQAGRLESVPGIGARRAAAIGIALDDLLRRRRRLGPGPGLPVDAPEAPVDCLLDVDREYRERAAAGTLPKIAPKRFNPEGLAWLPVLHTDRPGWHFTALYSNTARAHELDAAHDWVVLYAEEAELGARHERVYTAVTARRGDLAGRRVVRGREAECRSFYGQPALASA